MKKVVLLAVAVSASAAWADFYINFQAGYGFSVDPASDPTGNIPLLAEGEQATVQLIYAGANGVPDFDSAAVNAAGGTTYTLSTPYAVSGDDVLLAQFLTDPATNANDWSGFATFTETIRAPYRGSGQVYGRIFNAAGTEWFQQPGVFAASDISVDAVPPPFPERYFFDNGSEDAETPAFVGLQPNGDAYEVVPEPSSLALIGVLSVGAFAFRRMFRRR